MTQTQMKIEKNMLALNAATNELTYVLITAVGAIDVSTIWTIIVSSLIIALAGRTCHSSSSS